MPADALKCKECGPPIHSRRGSSASAVSARSRSAYYAAGGRSRGAAAADPGRSAHALALRGLPAAGAHRREARCRPAGRRWSGPIGWPARLGIRRVVDQERDREPDALVQGPRRLDRPGPGDRARLRHPRLRLHRQPRERGRRPRRGRGPAGLRAHPADLEEQKVLATGAYGAQIVAVQGNYDEVNRLCIEVSGERPGWAFVNINVRPYYAEGSKTLAFETVEQLGWELPDRVVGADRLRLAVHEDRARVPGVHRRRAGERRHADDERRAGRGLLAGGQAYAAGTTSAGRSSPTRSPSRWRSATRPTARTRSSSRGAPAAGSTPSPTTRSARHPAARRDDRHLHRDRRRRHDRRAGQARRARRHRARERVVPRSPATA